MYYIWDKSRAEKHLDNLCDSVEEITIKDYVRDMDLNNIKNNEAYAMNAVHLYVDILNLEKIMTTSNGTESETTHKRAIRFFDSHVRAIKYILAETESIFVDFHNQRLHAVITKPYGAESEKARIDKAIAIADLIIDSSNQQREVDGDDYIEAADIRIGIDSGLALAVNNGRRNSREPLFLGDPANHAAKHSFGEEIGIYLTNNSRNVIGLKEVKDSKLVSLSMSEIEQAKEDANLSITCDEVLNEQKNNDKKLSDFNFSRTEPPLKSLEFDNLYYKSAKRQEIVSIYADIDGFTKFISNNINTEDGKKNIVRALHVLRSELDATLTEDYAGRRVRFIGDCLHGLICEGTKKSTDFNKTVDVATEAVAGLRSSFNMALDKLEDNFSIDGIDKLGLAIGFEIGDVTLTRVGKQGASTRYAIGTSVIESEESQKICNGTESKIGDKAFKYLDEKYQVLFQEQIATDLTFQSIEKTSNNSKTSKSAIYDSSIYVNTSLKAHAQY